MQLIQHQALKVVYKDLTEGRMSALTTLEKLTSCNKGLIGATILLGLLYENDSSFEKLYNDMYNKVIDVFGLNQAYDQ